MSIPNLITLARILMVPVLVWTIISGEMGVAFLLFVAAGVSDALDGFLAKRFGMASELGAYLDPLADKALIVSIYVSLGIAGRVPAWLVILVVSRDVMIVAGVLLSWLLNRPLTIKPLLISKLNTVAQIVFAALVLGDLGLHIQPGSLLASAMALSVKLALALVVIFTLLSIACYLLEWVRHMNAAQVAK